MVHALNWFRECHVCFGRMNAWVIMMAVDVRTIRQDDRTFASLNWLEKNDNIRSWVVG